MSRCQQMQQPKTENRELAGSNRTIRSRSPKRAAKPKLLLAGVILTLVVLLLLYWSVDHFGRGTIRASGGMYFFKQVELDVPLYRQSDPRWKNDFLGPTRSTLGQEGCAVAAAAMVLSYYGTTVDPQKLNQFLTQNAGYTDRGWIYWEKAAELTGKRLALGYEDLPSFHLIDSNLKKKNPVIVRVRYPNGITHFVVVVGKRGFDYLIRDPGAGWSKGTYPLRELAKEIEALRFYKNGEI